MLLRTLFLLILHESSSITILACSEVRWRTFGATIKGVVKRAGCCTTNMLLLLIFLRLAITMFCRGSYGRGSNTYCYNY